MIELGIARTIFKITPTGFDASRASGVSKTQHFQGFCCFSEVNCGVPPSLPLSVMIWRGDTKVGSSVSYKCIEGFYNIRKGDTLVCYSEGIWSHPDFLCQGIFLCFFSC
uniref:Sushi domain-containing protein n=1 Tax=Sinocyclocheilus anshuiensis TaxID=1608454 RepID=A0A671NI59_9TELE